MENDHLGQDTLTEHASHRRVYLKRAKKIAIAAFVLTFLAFAALGQRAPGWFKDMVQTVQDFGASGLSAVWKRTGASPLPQPTFQNDASPLPVIPEVASYEEQVIRVVQHANPSVVSIIVSKDLPIIEQYFVNPFGDWGIEVPDGFGIPQYRQKGTQKQEIGGGTGFVVASDGLIVTNKHVVSDAAAEYTVLLNDGTRLSAQVVSKDPVLDLAVLRVQKAGLQPLPIGDSAQLKLGQTVIAIGNALGEFRNTVSVGVVSGLGRTLQVQGEFLTDLIQTDAAINQGNSGGPLLNLKGEVIGINTAMALSAENIGFTIPINQVRRSIEQVEANGEIKTAYLGIRYVLVNKDIQERNTLPVAYGAWISSDGSAPAVEPSSPAEKAGLKEGDIILELDNKKIAESSPLSVLLKQYSPGDAVSVKVLRSGAESVFRLVLGSR